MKDHIQAVNNFSDGRSVWLVYKRQFLGLAFFLTTVTALVSYKPFQLIIANPLTIFLSLISYNWYLWHYVIALELKAMKIPSSLYLNPMEDLYWRQSYFWIALLSGIAVSTIITYAYERPIAKLTALLYNKLITRKSNKESNAPTTVVRVSQHV